MPLPIALDSISDFSTTRVLLIKGKTLSSVPAQELFDAANVQTALGYTPANVAGDTFTGPINMGGNSITNVAAIAAANMISSTSSSNFSGGTFSAIGATAGWRVINGNLHQLSVTTTALTGQMGFFNPNGAVGTINTSATSTVYNTSSDSRLKVNFQDFDGGPIIDGIQVKKYQRVEDGSIQHGVVAQDLYAVYPEAVSPGLGSPGDEDFIPWMVDYSKLVSPLLREVKALRLRVKKLEAQLATIIPTSV